MRQILFCLLLLCIGQFPEAALAQGNTLNPGTIIDTVWCRDDPGQSYALYLPTSYHPGEKWPIIYIFEPAARGRLPLAHLRLASEAHRMVLVASNNSRNGSWSESFTAAQAVFDDTWRRFTIDTGRVYACGFSGGARVATALALNSGRIAGVLACGAGFPTVPEYQPQPDMRFAWVGVVGNRDMNFLEMHQVQAKIIGWEGRGHLIEFDGRHTWPAEDTLLMALDLLQLEAARQGTASLDANQQNQIVERHRKRAADLAKMGRKYEAGTYLEQLNATFPAWFGAEDKEKAEGWLAEKEATKQENERQRVLKREEELQRKFSEQFILDLNSPDDSACARFWKEEGGFLAKMQGHKSLEKARMADRLVNQLWVRCYEMGQRALAEKDYRSSATYYLIWSCVQPRSIVAHYLAARGFAGLGKTKQALEHLKMAVDNGMADLQRLEAEEFLDLKETKTYKKIRAQMQDRKSDKTGQK